MMKNFADGLALLVITAWVGGLWGIGYVAVPVLFQALPGNQMAGSLAGKMLTLAAYISIASACYLLAYHLKTSGRAAFRLTVFWSIVAMLLLAMVGHFGIHPILVDLKEQALPADVMHSAFADRFRALHGVSSVLYLAECLLGAVLVLKTKRC